LNVKWPFKVIIIFWGQDRQWKGDNELNIIPRSHSYCLGLSLWLCLEWYNGSITPQVHSRVTKPAQCRLTTTAGDRGISVLNNCLEWDKFTRLTLTYPTPDSCLTYTYYIIMLASFPKVPNFKIHVLDYPTVAGRPLSREPHEFLTPDYGNIRFIPYIARIWSHCATPSSLIVWVYLHSNFRGGLRKTHVF